MSKWMETEIWVRRSIFCEDGATKFEQVSINDPVRAYVRIDGDVVTIHSCEKFMLHDEDEYRFLPWKEG